MQLKTISAFRSGLLAAGACLFVSTMGVRAEEPPLRDLLRDGLFAEEVSRDPEAAAKRYEELITRFSEDRDFAAAALFRLAEVRRKQDRKEEAIALYQKLLAEFPTSLNETKLARENLATLGGSVPEVKTGVVDAEAQEVARLQALAKSSPDVLTDPHTFEKACGEGWMKVVKLMLDAGCDPFSGRAFADAAEEGHLEILKLLMAKNAEIPKKVVREAVEGAISSDRPAVLRFLLEKGLKPEGVQGFNGDIPPLLYALGKEKLAAAEILVANGADINAIVDFRIETPSIRLRGTALHFAILSHKFEGVKWLLKKGAEVDIPSVGHHFTPLHCALILSGDGSIPLVESLLQAGADPNASVTTWEEGGKEFRDTDRYLEKNFITRGTALVMAVGAGSNAETELLLKHGAKPAGSEKKIGEAIRRAEFLGRIDARPFVEKMLDAGASAKHLELLSWAAERKNPALVKRLLGAGAPANDPETMARAIQSEVPEILVAILDAGADPNMDLGQLPEFQSTARHSPLVVASINPGLFPMLKLLVEKGAVPDASWVKDGYPFASPEVRQYLTRIVRYPEFAVKPAITFQSEALTDSREQSKWLELATAVPGSAPPDFATLMLENGKRFPKHGTLTERTWTDQVVLVRRDPNGKFTEKQIDLSGKEPYPALAWGDIIRQDQDRPGGTVGNDWPGPQRWALRKRLSFTVTTEIEGQTREIQVRGDRVIFDPTKEEVPLCNAQMLVNWLCPQISNIGSGSSDAIILATRKGWPEVPLAVGTEVARQFQLQPGDHIKFEIPQRLRDELTARRAHFVSFQVPGLPFRRDIKGNVDGELNPIRIPTLIQALVDMQVPHGTALENWAPWSVRTTLDAGELARAAGIFSDFTLLPHPDLAKIRIRRLVEAGGEKVIDVDLEKEMASASTVEAARKADVVLQCGDVVELQLKTDPAAGPWKGFTPEVEGFFAKALSGRVQITDPDGKVAILEMDYRAPRSIETEIGLIPSPPTSGLPSVTGLWVSGRRIGTFTRPGVPRGKWMVSPQDVFVRDGDAYADYQGGPNELRKPPVRLSPPSQ